MKAQVLRVFQILSRNKWPIFLLWSLWLTLEYFGLGPFSYLRIHDWGDSIFPMRLGLIREFFESGFSYWTNIAACGFDRLAATGTFFQLDSLLFLTLPGWLSCGLVAFLQRFLAGYFTYRLCKDYLKLDELPSIVAGLAYSVSFFYFQGQFAGEAGFPFILWSLERANEMKNVTRYIFAFLLGLFVLFSSSFALIVPFMLPMALAWFILVRRKYSFRFLSLFAVFCVTLLAGEIPYIWALLVNAPLSHRADWEIIDPFLLNLPILWVGRAKLFISSNIVYLSIGILGLYLSRLKERSLLMVMVLLGFCGMATTLWDSVGPYLKQYIGYFKGFQFDRFHLLAPFFAIITAAYGLHLVRPNWVLTQDNSHNKIKYRVQTILCIISISFVVFNSFSMKYNHGLQWGGGIGYCYTVNYENPDLQHIATDIDSAPFRVGTIAYGLHPAYANAYGLETVDGYVVLYSQRYQDFWGEVIEPLTSKDEVRYQYFHGWGSRIYLLPPSDGSFSSIEEIPFSEYYNLNLLSLANTKYLISESPVSNEHLTLLPSQLPDIEKPHGSPTFKKVIQGIKFNVSGMHLYIYENELCFPRFFLSGKAMVFENSDQLLEAMANADIDSLRNNVFIDEAFVSKINLETLGFTHGELTIERYSPDEIVLSVDLDKPGILVVSNSYNPYWICKVNGVEKNIFPVYHTFMGVFLEEGENVVQLEYCPPYWISW